MSPERRTYLEGLADEFGLPRRLVFDAASVLGPSEDYDGLVTSLEDLSDEYEREYWHTFQDVAESV